MKRVPLLKSACLLVLLFCTVMHVKTAFSADPVFAREEEPILPVPLKHDVSLRKAALGKRLFHETLLSGDNSLSCASCHDVTRSGAEASSSSTGIEGQKGVMNAPTVINSRFNFAQFWDGRVTNLREQAKGPITNPIEMGATWKDVIAKLRRQPDYVRAFKEVYREGITEDTIADAIQTYEYTLVSANSPFDKYLRGDDNAISEQEKHGYKLFKEYGCITCHQGVNVGGNMFQRIGAFLPYFNEENTAQPKDLGRYNVTKDTRDLYVFKVPGLRMVAHTAPYFHDGSVATLGEAIDIMARYQLGYTISKSDNQDIQAFLGSLSGRFPHEETR